MIYLYTSKGNWWLTQTMLRLTSKHMKISVNIFLVVMFVKQLLYISYYYSLHPCPQKHKVFSLCFSGIKRERLSGYVCGWYRIFQFSVCIFCVSTFPTLLQIMCFILKVYNKKQGQKINLLKNFRRPKSCWVFLFLCILPFSL